MIKKQSPCETYYTKAQEGCCYMLYIILLPLLYLWTNCINLFGLLCTLVVSFYTGLYSEIDLMKYMVSFVSEHFIFCFVFQSSVNPFFPNAPFLYPPKASENHKIFWCFQGIGKGFIGNKWVNQIMIIWNMKTKHLQTYGKV